jgi:hypothetical protein
MRHKRLKLSVVLLLGLGLTSIHAQEAVSAAGGNASGSGGSVSYTIGQIVYSYDTGTDATVAQGVQQPYEISIVTGIEDSKDISLEFVVYPNPATDFVILKTGGYDTENLKYYLYTNSGKVLVSGNLQGDETNISMAALLPSAYFLKVMNNTKVIKTFKIIKK